MVGVEEKKNSKESGLTVRSLIGCHISHAMTFNVCHILCVRMSSGLSTYAYTRAITHHLTGGPLVPSYLDPTLNIMKKNRDKFILEMNRTLPALPNLHSFSYG
jgi:hypothetical protein